MESNGAENFFVGSEAEGSETSIEIKIKTLDSQTYTLRVDKQVPVPALKEQIASVTGVLSEQQRLICRGKVLKDDQLLSAYHVEDGHTLHLVVRQPVPPSSDGTLNHPGRSRNHGNQVPSNVVIETFNVPDRGDGVPPEINQIVSAVLGSFGFSNIGIGGNVIDLREHVSQRHEGTSVDSGVPDLTQQPPEQGGVRVQSNRPQSAFGIPTAISLGTLPPPVIPDSLTTLTVYLSQMRHDVDAYGRGVDSNAQASAMDSTEERDSNSASHSGTVREPLQQEGVLREGFLRDGLPTPAALAEVMMSTRQFLIEQTAECLQLLVGLLDNQANVNDSSVRNSSQASTWRTGLLLHNLGAYLLELGRTTMTMRFGQTPSEAVINAGPAVFISPSGPNPLMVQPLSSFGAIPVGPVQPPGSGLANGRGAGFHPRRIDIQIRRGSNANQDERGNNQQTQGQVNSTTASGTGNLGSQTTSRNPEGPSVAGESGVRVLPIRTMVAAMPAPFSRLPSDSSGNPVGLYYPVLGRFQHVATGLVSGEQGHQASSEHQPVPVQVEQSSVPGSVWQQIVENPPRNGSSPNPSSRRRDLSRPRSVNVSILSARGTLNSQEPERQIHGGVFQLLRNLFPAGEIHLDDASLEGTAPGSVPDRTAAPVADHAALPVTDCAALPVADCAALPVADHAGTPVEDCVMAPVADHTATSVADGADCTGTSNGPSAEANVTDEGIFLSNLLHQIMPVISQHTGAEPISASMEEANTSEYRVAQESSTHAGSSNVGTSRRQSDSEPSLPNPKRQKIE